MSTSKNVKSFDANLHDVGLSPTSCDDGSGYDSFDDDPYLSIKSNIIALLWMH